MGSLSKTPNTLHFPHDAIKYVIIFYMTLMCKRLESTGLRYVLSQINIGDNDKLMCLSKWTFYVRLLTVSQLELKDISEILLFRPFILQVRMLRCRETDLLKITEFYWFGNLWKGVSCEISHDQTDCLTRLTAILLKVSPSLCALDPMPAHLIENFVSLCSLPPALVIFSFQSAHLSCTQTFSRLSEQTSKDLNQLLDLSGWGVSLHFFLVRLQPLSVQPL